MERQEQNTSIKQHKEGLAVASFILGLVAFIPLVGVLLGILAIILGIIGIKKIKKGGLSGKKLAISGIILGVLGIIFTFVIYGSLFYFGFKADHGPFLEPKIEMSRSILTQNAGALELYKKQNGQYPDNLKQASDSELTIYPVDSFLTPLYYKLSEDGQSYDLRSLGPDKEYGTEDDIFPLVQ